jgi:hypothetical protein
LFASARASLPRFPIASARTVEADADRDARVVSHAAESPSSAAGDVLIVVGGKLGGRRDVRGKLGGATGTGGPRRPGPAARFPAWGPVCENRWRRAVGCHDLVLISMGRMPLQQAVVERIMASRSFWKIRSPSVEEHSL